MRINQVSYAALIGLAALTVPLTAAAQDQAQNQPLSVIDWLDRNPVAPPPTSVALPPPDEPPVTRSGTVPRVTVAPLNEEALRQVGLVPASVSGLPTDLWNGSDPDAIGALLADLPNLRLPAAQSLLYSLLLTEAEGPEGDRAARDAFSLARVAALVELGALDPAMGLIEQAGVARDKAHFATYMEIALLTGAEDAACTRMAQAPYLAPSQAHRVFCAVRAGRWTDAALMLDTGRALGLLAPDTAELLDRFLNADLYEDAAPLRTPRRIDALTFRLYESIGEPLSSRALPRAYAVADLRDLAGWKSQLEAAERLARTGALPDNRLLGLYTDRLPAASGGIWDRVEALQRFDVALRTGSPEAVTKTLPDAWRAMQAAELEVPFANLFASEVSRLPLTGRAGDISFHMGLLSPEYEDTAAALPRTTDAASFLAAVARGQSARIPSDDPIQQAVANGFGDAAPRDDLIAMASNGELGAAILRCLILLNDGARGDTPSLATALSTLRALGLEDTARRAALQMLLLERDAG